MGIISALKCRECNKEYSPRFLYICEDCFGPLDVQYKIDNDTVKNSSESRSNDTKVPLVFVISHQKREFRLNNVRYQEEYR